MIKSNAINTYLKNQASLDLLRFITCGSVDDGKSTLIGRMLYESQMIFDDQVASLKNDSKKYGTQGEDIDFALIVDGLSAEREQGITIDVAYRFFSSNKRKFIVADTPGHEQYTRNMVTGASTADVAIILIDARKGIDMFNQLNVPIHGMIENMSTHICPKCGHEEHVFGHGGVSKEAEKIGVPVLAEVPLHLDIRSASDGGVPIVVSDPSSPQANVFNALAKSMVEKGQA